MFFIFFSLYKYKNNNNLLCESLTYSNRCLYKNVLLNNICLLYNGKAYFAQFLPNAPIGIQSQKTALSKMYFSIVLSPNIQHLPITQVELINKIQIFSLEVYYLSIIPSLCLCLSVSLSLSLSEWDVAQR